MRLLMSREECICTYFRTGRKGAFVMDPRTKMLLEAPVGPTILRLALPNVVVMVVQASIGLIETYFFARLGPPGARPAARPLPAGRGRPPRPRRPPPRPGGAGGGGSPPPAAPVGAARGSR